MRRSYGLAIDPGLSTGVCLFSWSGDQDGHFKQEELWQFGGGAEGLSRFLASKSIRLDGKRLMFADAPLAAMVVERFTPRDHEGFSLTLKSVEPLRGEGVLIGRGFGPHIDWAEPAHQYFMGGTSLADKKKRSREFLKLHGLYVTGSMIGQKDADDAISAELHAIAWLRRKRHMPTLVELFQEEE